MNARQTQLLLVADRHRGDALCQELALDGYEVSRADYDLLTTCRLPCPIELVLLAPTDPARRLKLLRALRTGELAPALPASVRILWICATAETSELLRAFRDGADDVLRGPWGYPELLARIRALLARRAAPLAAVIRCGALEIDTATRHARFASTPVALRRIEYELLVHLAGEPERVHTKQELLREVWGYRTASTRTLDTHACRLRRALADAGAPAETLITVWGVGYRLSAVDRVELRVLPGRLRA